ncbi:hypothetical protein RSSM_02237 [Rhodopirellula sallentina SM41]|uniref:Uncharacterized protein n=1 Tax=Rhodopirellula sallentina SM41 TaxID=1263870 RepID=M5U4Y1_9BACT|nr:hypothetical protein RSSM_02237 [Rhodopirellula sallentina SM41]
MLKQQTPPTNESSTEIVAFMLKWSRCLSAKNASHTQQRKNGCTYLMNNISA